MFAYQNFFISDGKVHVCLYKIVCVLQITYSVPFSVTAELTADSGGGQGLLQSFCS